MKRLNIKNILITTIILTSMLGILGLSYAFYSTIITGNENASSIITNVGSLKLNFVDGNYINATNILSAWTATKTITVRNTGTHTVSYYLMWEELNNTLVNQELLTYTITGTGSGVGALARTQIPRTGNNINILGQITIAPNVTHTYTITFNYEITSADQSSDMEKIFAGKLKISEHLLWKDECYANPNNLNCKIYTLNSTNGKTIQTVANDTMFASAATTDQGLWVENRAGKTENNQPVYFFRGAAQNNYVSFAGKKWRIVRINEDGTIKLILGGNTTTDGYGGTAQFNSSNNLPEHVDYNHPTNELREANEDWYTDDDKGNLDEYESYIADTKFCNDKSIVSTSGSNKYYGANFRIRFDKTPQYKCPNASDNYIYKIGALTADEVAYAGGLMFTNNASYYLYDNAQSDVNSGYWWLLSPLYYEGSIARLLLVLGPSNPGYLTHTSVYSLCNFRPVISLKSDTAIINGDGSSGSPYRIT